MQNPHDALFGAVFADPRQAKPVLLYLLPPDAREALAGAEFVPVPKDSTTARLRQQRTDMVFQVHVPGAADRDPVVLTLYEHKKGGRAGLQQQLTRDVVAISHDWTRQHSRPPIVLPVVVHHGAQPLRPPTWRRLVADRSGYRGVLATLAAYDPQLSLLLLDLCNFTESQLVALPLPPLGRLCLVFLQFMPRAREQDCLDRLERLADLLRAAAGEPGGQHGIQQLHSYLLYVTGVSPDRLAECFARILQPLDPTTMISTAKRLRDEGRIEGKIEGKQEGRIEGKAELVLCLLEARFGAVPEAAARRISAACADDLDALGLRLLRATTLDEALGDER